MCNCRQESREATTPGGEKDGENGAGGSDEDDEKSSTGDVAKKTPRHNGPRKHFTWDNVTR